MQSDFKASLIRKAFEAFSNGRNITQSLLMEGMEIDAEAIDLIYEFQSGLYTSGHRSDPVPLKRFAEALIDAIHPILSHVQAISRNGVMLDVGCGEGTSLLEILTKLGGASSVMGTDISSSRLSFARQNLGVVCRDLHLARCDSAKIPLSSNCVDLVWSIHALEPNSQTADAILGELLRVTRRFVVLAEPEFEAGDNRMRDRMNAFSYVKGIEDKLEHLDVKVIAKRRMSGADVLNSLNRTTVWILEKREMDVGTPEREWLDPIFMETLRPAESDGWIISDRGIAYPVWKDVPQLSISDARLFYSRN